MRKLSFHDRWISPMLMCITMVSYSILINGEAKGNIIPSRGLRQGDPLSLYLFLLCIEGLSAKLRKEEIEGAFLPHEAEAILGMTISSRPVENLVIWAWTTNGKFSVKNAYKVAQKWLKDQNHKVNKGSTSNNTHMCALWRLVWSLNCPNKLKQFMWRSCWNTLQQNTDFKQGVLI